MKKLTSLLLALGTGVLLGFFITKLKSPAISEQDTKFDSTNGSAFSGSSNRHTSGTKVRDRSASSSSRGLDGLMKLTKDSWYAQDSIDFLMAIEQLSAQEIAAMVSDLEKLDPNDTRRYRLLSALLNRWALLDPDGAWAAAAQCKDKNLKQQMIGLVMGVISRSNLGKAQTLLLEIKDPNLKGIALLGFLNEAASHDPEEAFRLLVSEPLNSQGYSHYHTLFSKWAKENPDAAIAKLSEIKGSQNRQQALHGIVTALVGTDPKKALSMLNEMPPGQSRSRTLASIASIWMQKDSDAAIAWVNELPPADRAKALQNISWQLGQEDPAKAAKLLSSIPANNQTSYEFSRLANQWASQDLSAAQKWAESLPAGQAKEQAMSGIINALAQSEPSKAAEILSGKTINNQNSQQVGTLMGEWIKTDQKAALSWLDSLDLRGDAQRNVYSQFLSNWVDEDPNAASNYTLGIQDPQSRQQAISNLVESWGNSDPGAAKEWIMKSLQSDERNSTLNSLIQNLTYDDPSTALEYYQEATAGLTPDAIGKTFQGAASQIANQLAENDPLAACKWVTSIPEGQIRTDSIRSMVDSMGRNDIKSAAEFVNTLAQGKERDNAVASLVSNLGRQGDSASAFDWAASVSDVKQRENMIQNAVNQWKKYDKTSAKAAVQRADISIEVKNKILKGL